MECCGLTSHLDWINNSTGDFGTDLAFPSSCCVDQEVVCNRNNATDPNTIHSSGCIDAVTEFISEQLLVVAAIAIAFVIGEVIMLH